MMKSSNDKLAWSSARALCIIHATCTYEHCRHQAASVVVTPLFCGYWPASTFFVPLVGTFDSPSLNLVTDTLISKLACVVSLLAARVKLQSSRKKRRQAVSAKVKKNGGGGGGGVLSWNREKRG